jgi:tRNA dimethylallyltransferase
VGTDKLPPEQRQGVPHHLIDVVDPDQTFSAAQFARAADEIVAETRKSGGAVIVAGGTGFYLRALLWGLFPGPSAASEVRERLFQEAAAEGLVTLHKRLAELDPEAARRIHPHDRVRIVRALEVYEITGRTMSEHFACQALAGPRYNALIIGLILRRETMYERINRRVEQMIAAGLVAEVERLRARGYGPELPSQQALGYKQVHRFLDGEIDLDRARYLIQRDTRHYARRQLTWLRKEPGLEWMPAEDSDAIVERGLRFLTAPGGNDNDAYIY